MQRNCHRRLELDLSRNSPLGTCRGCGCTLIVIVVDAMTTLDIKYFQRSRHVIGGMFGAGSECDRGKRGIMFDAIDF